MLCVHFTCMYVCILCAFLVPEEIRQGSQIPWDWLRATMGMLRIEPGFSAGTSVIKY